MVKESVWGRRAIVGGVLVLASWLTGCAQPTSPTATATENDGGTLAISLTDKPGDFANYAVRVSDLTLTHANGAVVHTIAQPVTVDFAQYVQVSEFLTLLPVRHGRYTKATMTLDYTQANIQVEGNDGKPVAVNADNILGTDGAKISTLTVDVELDGPTALTIAPGLLRHLHLDFDLAATNKVSFDDMGVPSVTVEPTLIAEVDPHQFKEHRLRGLLQTVDADNKSFVIEMRPFMAALAHTKTALHDRDDHKLFGDVTVQTTDKTKFTVNGVEVANADGLGEMNKMTRPARVVIKGTPKFNPLRIEAAEVDARTVDQTADQAVLEGTVLKRVADKLMVRGAVEDKVGDVRVAQDVEVVIVDATAITTWRPRQNGTATGADISVGQRLHVAGALSADGKSLNAAKIHLQATLIAGKVVNVTTEPRIATLNLASIDGIAIAAFDFTGTGKAPTETANFDAKGDAYTVSLGSLNLGSAALVRIVGNPVAFGTADAYAFESIAAVDLTSVPVLEDVRWAASTPLADALTIANTNDLISPVVGDGDKYSVAQAGIKIQTATAPAIKGAAGDGLYVIQQPGRNAIFNKFTDFAAALAMRNGNIKSMRAQGRYEADNNTLSATFVSVSLERVAKVK